MCLGECQANRTRREVHTIGDHHILSRVREQKDTPHPRRKLQESLNPRVARPELLLGSQNYSTQVRTAAQVLVGSTTNGGATGGHVVSRLRYVACSCAWKVELRRAVSQSLLKSCLGIHCFQARVGTLTSS